MVKKRMEFLRDIINIMIVAENINEIELLKRSQELDILILQDINVGNYGKTVLGDELMNEFKIIVDKLQLFEKMYHSMRIIDPVKKKVLEIKANEVCETDDICHDFWQKQMICDNCISMRAYNEDDTIFKIENKGKNIYMVTAVPISVKGKKLVVELMKDTTNNLYYAAGKNGDEVKILSTIEHMNQAVVKDELTDLYNRRYINEKLPADLLNASLKDEPLSIIFADLDFFKAVNDTYGHSAGDKVLREFAIELKKYVRGGKDWIARYGGEEFIICLSNTNIDAAKAVAERIRKNIAQKEFSVGNEKIHLTCSFGVHTVYNGDECLTIEGIIELADKKLYKAKNEGRNKVV